MIRWTCGKFYTYGEICSLFANFGENIVTFKLVPKTHIMAIQGTRGCFTTSFR